MYVLTSVDNGQGENIHVLTLGDNGQGENSHADQARGNKFALKHYILITVKDTSSRPLLQSFKSSTPRSCKITMTEFKQNLFVSVLESADKLRNPSFHIHTSGSKQLPLLSNSISCPKILPPQPRAHQLSFILVTVSNIHLEPGSEKKGENCYASLSLLPNFTDSAFTEPKSNSI